MKKLLALLLALVMVLSLVACTNNDQPEDTTTEPGDTSDTTTESTTETTTEPERDALENYEYGVDYVTLYEQYGDQVTIDMVEEEDGIAYVEIDGERYELGMDFLSMAMVYNTDPIEGNDAFDTADEIYNEWWKLYIQRWNYLVPELPLYSNQYYHIFNAKIQNYEVNPYWAASQAMVYCTVDETLGSNSIILGSSTDLTGSFRYASMGVSNPSGSDLDISNMVNGLDTVVATKEGAFAWNDTVVAAHDEVNNEDGSKTITVQICDDLLFSDGSAITAKNYLAHVLAFSTPVATEAAGKDHMSGKVFAGYDEFADYDGTEGSGSKVFSGIRLIDDYTFSVTIAADHLPYYYDISYGAFSPVAMGLWLGDCDILDDGEGCYLSDEFYAKDGDSYTMASHIAASKHDYTTYPWSGPYTVTEFNESELTATLTLNPYFKGTYDGATPSVETISYVKMVPETQAEWLTTGKIDVMTDITGADATDAALKILSDYPGQYGSTYYNRAGYGMLSFRCDFGPASFTEVRQAVAYSIDRNKFAKDFTGGYGIVVNGPYYTGSAAYLANEDTILLDAYAASEASAIAVLEEGGWIYNADGTEYTGEGIRYKKLSKSEQSAANLGYASQDGAYKTVEVDGEYYMPLVINWFCTEDNDVSEMLKTAWDGSEITAAIGMDVQWQQGTWAAMQGERQQYADYGYAGTPLYSAFNFATGFTSAAYDYAYNWSPEPYYFENYSVVYMKDEADILWMN